MRKARIVSWVRLPYNAPALIATCHDDTQQITKEIQVIAPSHALCITSIMVSQVTSIYG